MLDISPIQEEVIARGFTLQVRKWHAYASCNKPVSAAAMQGDLNDIQNIWVPGKKISDDGLVTDREATGADLTKGFRASRRFVIVYNSSNEIAVYAKFTVAVDKLKLDYITSATEGGLRIECGGAKPVPATLAFLAAAATILKVPVYLNADGANAQKLIETYKKSGWELTGKEDGSGTEMVLEVQHLDRPLVSHNPQREGVHWKYGGEGSLRAYLDNGAR